MRFFPHVYMRAFTPCMEHSLARVITVYVGLLIHAATFLCVLPRSVCTRAETATEMAVAIRVFIQ
jgi:hypothetical protein